MSPLADPENPPVPPCPCRCLCPNRDQNRDPNWDQHRDPSRDQNWPKEQNWDQHRDQNRDQHRDPNWDQHRDQNRDQNRPKEQKWDQHRDLNWDQHRDQHRDPSRSQPWDPNRDQNRDQHRNPNWDQHRDPDRSQPWDPSRDQPRAPTRSRCRRLAPALAALAALALGAAAAAAAALGTLRGQPPLKAATAAHVLLSAGSLSLPSSPAWRYEDGIQGVFLSGDVRPDTAGTLQVTSGGLYLLYGQLGLTCTATKCPQGRVTLWLRRAASPRPLLAVPLTLPAAAGGHQERSALAQAVAQLWPGDVLSLELVGDTTGDAGGWQLAQDEREDNFVGLLRIAGG